MSIDTRTVERFALYCAGLILFEIRRPERAFTAVRLTRDAVTRARNRHPPLRSQKPRTVHSEKFATIFLVIFKIRIPRGTEFFDLGF